MLPLAVLTFLQAIACVSMGEDTPSVFSAYLTSQGVPPYAISGGVGPVIPDIKPNVDLPINGVSLPAGTDGNKFSTSTASYPSELSLSEWSSRVCKQGSPVVEYFAQYFTENINASEKLRKAFQLNDITAETLSSHYYNTILNIQKQIGNPNAQELANLIYKAVKDNFHKAKEGSLLRINAYGGAKFLFYKGVLNTKNVLPLVQQYFISVKRNILSVKNPTPIENIKAIGLGFDEFAIPLGFFDKYSATMGVSILANEWYALDSNKNFVF